MIRVQILSELEEIAEYQEGTNPSAGRRNWVQRLELMQADVDAWLRILKVRGLLLKPDEEATIRVNFARMSWKAGRKQLAWRVLRRLLGANGEGAPGGGETFDLPPAQMIRANPEVVYAYMKFRWECNEAERQQSLRSMRNYTRFLGHEVETQAQAPENVLRLLARCNYKSSQWQRQLLSDSGTLEEGLKTVLEGYLAATSYDKSWYKAWHSWAQTNFELAAVWERNAQHPQHAHGSSSTHKSTRLNPYLVPAIQGFFRSIALSRRNSLQDSLRVLTLWFKYGGAAEVNAAVGDGFLTVPVDNWLQVIPQLIARIQVTSPQLRRLIHHVLADIGRYHPQALAYSLMVASKSQNTTRRAAAIAILDRMRAHSASLVEQVLLVGQELIRVAILWDELWHEGLEEASKLYFAEHNIPAMYAVLEPLHQLVRLPELLADVVHTVMHPDVQQTERQQHGAERKTAAHHGVAHRPQQTTRVGRWRLELLADGECVGGGTRQR